MTIVRQLIGGYQFCAYIRVSHSMVVLYIRDHEGLGFSGQKYQSKTSPTIQWNLFYPYVARSGTYYCLYLGNVRN